MEFYWNWSLCIILHLRSTTSAQMFRILRQEGRVFSISLPLLFSLLFFFFLWRMVLRRQWRNSIFICFLLFGFHRKGRCAFMCLICHSSDSVPAFKALGAVWTKPSVWVGRFIKWQTGSLYLANVSRGRWRWLVRVRVCVWWRDRHRKKERGREGTKFPLQIYHRRVYITMSLPLHKWKVFALWIYSDRRIREPFIFHLIPWNTN